LRLNIADITQLAAMHPKFSAQFTFMLLQVGKWSSFTNAKLIQCGLSSSFGIGPSFCYRAFKSGSEWFFKWSHC
jgi:hypothetical protein